MPSHKRRLADRAARERKTLKICLISHAHVEQQGYLPALTSIAAQPGVELALVTPEVYRACRIDLSLFAQARPAFQTFPVPVRFAGRQGTFVYRRAALRSALDAFQPDLLLHEQEVYALGAAQIAALARHRALPLVMFVWENIPRELSLPRRLLRRFVMRRCDGLLAGSMAAAWLHQEWGFRGSLDVIPQMGIPATAAEPAFGRRDARCFRIVFAGRLIALKGVDCLLRAVAVLQSSGLAVHCTIAGDGPERARLQELAHSLKLEHHLTFLGTISLDAVASLLESSDVLVLPSRRSRLWAEQFGRILIEAMAKATVVLGSRTGAIPEVIGAEDLLFDENDHGGLAALLAALAGDPGLFKKQQRFLWERARDHYLNDALARRRVEFCFRLLGGQPAAYPVARQQAEA